MRSKIKKCKNCGKAIKSRGYKQYYLTRRKFCSTKCALVWNRKHKIGYFASMSLK